MLGSIQSTSLSPFTYSESFLNSLSAEIIIHRIKEIGIHIFSKISEFFNTFNKQSSEMNLKVFALISCLSLIALLVISMLCRNARIIPPTSEKIG